MAAKTPSASPIKRDRFEADHLEGAATPECGPSRWRVGIIRAAPRRSPIANQFRIGFASRCRRGNAARPAPRPEKISSMPRFLIAEPAEAILGMLGDALDIVDFGIVLLNRDLRVRFINRRAEALWNTAPALLTTAPTFRELLNSVAADGGYGMAGADLTAYLDAREADVRAGSIPPLVIDLADGRHILFRCIASADGGRILTYADITPELRREASDAVARVNAELRFNSEIMEDQAAHLATLAEAAQESARKAEDARLLLEREIAERRQLEIRLRRLATTDGLTGALNRAELLAAAQREIDASWESGGKLVALMIDVDHFKAINDRFGHAGGDRALEQLVLMLRAGIRQVDLLGRLGGEEFAIVLPDTTATPAGSVAERLRARVAEAPVSFGEKLIPMTISIGLAAQLETDRSIEQVIIRADDALYRAKHAGRNQVATDQRPEAA
jgi:diguanylate cyclase (GGDEF)-like protein